MRAFSLLRTATRALSLIAATGAVSTAFAAPVQQQSPYDGSNFVIPQSQIFS